MLHELVARHAQSLLAELRATDPDDGGLPRYVERELVAYLCCSQWVFTVPKPLRLVLARDPEWTRWTGALVVGAIGAWQRRVARKRGLPSPRTGAVTFVQRFGGLVEPLAISVGHRHRTSDRRCSVGRVVSRKYDRTVIAYHGCDAETAERLLHGEPFKKSQNDYDWLGEGIYFWEYGADRALQFAHDQQRRRKVKTPAIVGAILQLGRCFDLMDSRFTDELPYAFEGLQKLHEVQGTVVPENAGATPDRLLRRRDCAVMNFYLDWMEANRGKVHDTVRCGFVEGGAAFDGAGIYRRSHVQIAVRNPACVVGVFRPTMYP